MKSSIRLIQILIPLLCIINAANAFIGRRTSQVCGQRQLQRGNRVLFQEQPTLKNEASNIEESEEKMTQTKKLMKKVKEAGKAGVISYALWELAFWFVSVSSEFLDESK